MDFVHNSSYISQSRIEPPRSIFKSQLHWIVELFISDTGFHGSGFGLAFVLLLVVLNNWWWTLRSSEKCSSIFRYNLNPFYTIRRRIDAWKYLFWGPDIIQTAYNNVDILSLSGMTRLC